MTEYRTFLSSGDFSLAHTWYVYNNDINDNNDNNNDNNNYEFMSWI